MWKLPFRPEGSEGSLEDQLPGIQTSLVQTLAKAQDRFTHKTLKLTRSRLQSLSVILAEFAMDLHCGIGLWRGLERYHREFFGTTLPMIPESEADRPSEEISPARVRHLLWIVYPRMIPDLLVAPEHVDLIRVADVVAGSLREQFANLPRESQIKQFLGTPDEYGSDVKRKLVWLGTQSYLFRFFFERYCQDENAKPTDVSVVDDFLCQECTEWAGLGAPEILANVLDLPAERRTDLLSWSERHNAMYKVLSGSGERIEVLNVINDRKYRVRMNLERNPFPRGCFVHGSLVPWGGEWCWSGMQQTFERLDGPTIARLKKDYRKLPSMYYRYSPEELKKARRLVREQYDEFVVARHGKDWVAYPDGLAMAADWQNAASAKIASLSPGDRKRLMEKHGMKTPSPQITLPPDLLESKGGIGVYFNPEEGMEIIQDFDDILSGLRKRGTDLTRGEEETIRGWIWSESISPGFVRQLVAEYGLESIKAAFLGKHEEGYVLEYLMRRYKGRFYRPRYPTLTLV